jgi:hypothetical protein
MMMCDNIFRGRAMVGVPKCSKCLLGEGQVIKNDVGP